MIPLSDNDPQMNFLLWIINLQPSDDNGDLLESWVSNTEEYAKFSDFMVKSLSIFNCVHGQVINRSQQSPGNE